MSENRLVDKGNLGHVQMFGIYPVPEELVEPEGVTITRLLSPFNVHISAPDPTTQIISISYSTVMDGNIVKRISLIDWCKVITRLGEKEGLSDKRIHALCCIPLVQRAKNISSLPEEPTPSSANKNPAENSEKADEPSSQDGVVADDSDAKEHPTTSESHGAEGVPSFEEAALQEETVPEQEESNGNEEDLTDDDAPILEEVSPLAEAPDEEPENEEAPVLEATDPLVIDEGEEAYANEEEDTIGVTSSNNNGHVDVDESIADNNITDLEPCSSQRITLGRDPKCAPPRIIGIEVTEEDSGSPDSQTLDGNLEQPLFQDGDKKKKKKHHKKDKKRHRQHRDKRSSESESDRPKKKRRVSIEEGNSDRLPIPKIVIRMNMEDDSRKAEIVRESTVHEDANNPNDEHEEEVLPSTSHETLEEDRIEPIVEKSPIRESLNLSDASATQTDPTLSIAETEEEPPIPKTVTEESHPTERIKWDEVGNWQYWLPASTKRDRLLPESTPAEKRFRLIIAAEPKLKRFYKDKQGWQGATKNRKTDDHRDAITVRFFNELSAHYEAARNFDSRLSSPPEPLERFGLDVKPQACQANHEISGFCIPINDNPYLISRIKNYKQLSLGQVVWAMWSRQEWWPGTIASFERGEKGEIAQVQVLWINEPTQNVVPYRNVLPFDYAFPYKFNVKSVNMKYLRAVSKAILIHGYVGYWEPFLNKSLFRCLSLDLDCHGMISHLPAELIKELLQPQTKEKEKAKKSDGKDKSKQKSKKQILFDEITFEAFLVAMFIKKRGAFPSGEFFTSTWELYGDFLESKYYPADETPQLIRDSRSPLAGCSATPETRSENNRVDADPTSCFQQITREEMEEALGTMPIHRHSENVDEENDRSAIDEYLEKDVQEVNPEDLKRDALVYKRVTGAKMKDIKASKACGRRTRILDYGPLCKKRFDALPGEDPDDDRLFQECEMRPK